MVKKGTICTLATIIFLGIPPTSTLAVNFIFDKNIVGTGKQEINLLINTQDKEINTISGTLTFSSKNIAVKDVSDASSLVNIWIEKPTLSENKIHFAGIIPGGYNGAHGQIIKIYTDALEGGEANFYFEEAIALLNDGLGTESKIEKNPLKIKSSGLILSATSSKTTNIPPETFSPMIISDPNIYSGKNILIFSTTDKGSGIDHYEVLETGIDDIGVWKNAESPYLLEDQKLKNDIYIRAVSKDKSFIVVKIPAKNISDGVLGGQHMLFPVITILLLLIAGIAVYRKIR